MTVLPKRYVRGPLLSLSTITFPGVYSVIVPLPSVVVVVVVYAAGKHFRERAFVGDGNTRPTVLPALIRRRGWFGCQQSATLLIRLTQASVL